MGRFNSVKDRSGYTLIELLVSMVAATVLLAALTGTMVIATNLLETQVQDDESWRNREISDRISADLRYANNVQNSGYGYQITKANVSTGASETANYVSYTDGLTRQVDSGTVATLDESSPGVSAVVDGYTAATYLPADDFVRVRAVSTASESSPVSAVDCFYPTGCIDGDLLFLVIVADSDEGLALQPNDWFAMHNATYGSVRLVTAVKQYDSASPGPASLQFTDGSGIAATCMIAVENASVSDLGLSFAYAGFALDYLPFTHPTPLSANASVAPKDLNIQVIAAYGDPWPTGALGVSGFSDAATAACGSFSVGVAVRNGVQPTQTITPRYWQQQSGSWIKAAIRAGNGG